MSGVVGKVVDKHGITFAKTSKNNPLPVIRFWWENFFRIM